MQNKSIQISQATFERLQRNAIPLIDDVDAIINKALDALEAGQYDSSSRSKDSGGLAAEMESHSNLLEFDHQNRPSFRFTKIRQVMLNDLEIAKITWNGLLGIALKKALDEGFTIEKIRQLTPINLKLGHHSDSGFRYIKKKDVSFQGLDAQRAAESLFAFARDLDWIGYIIVTWGDSRDAAYPGRSAKIIF